MLTGGEVNIYVLALYLERRGAGNGAGIEELFYIRRLGFFDPTDQPS